MQSESSTIISEQNATHRSFFSDLSLELCLIIANHLSPAHILKLSKLGSCTRYKFNNLTWKNIVLFDSSLEEFIVPEDSERTCRYLPISCFCNPAIHTWIKRHYVVNVLAYCQNPFYSQNLPPLVRSRLFEYYPRLEKIRGDTIHFGNYPKKMELFFYDVKYEYKLRPRTDTTINCIFPEDFTIKRNRNPEALLPFDLSFKISPALRTSRVRWHYYQYLTSLTVFRVGSHIGIYDFIFDLVKYKNLRRLEFNPEGEFSGQHYSLLFGVLKSLPKLEYLKTHHRHTDTYQNFTMSQEVPDHIKEHELEIMTNECGNLVTIVPDDQVNLPKVTVLTLSVDPIFINEDRKYQPFKFQNHYPNLRHLNLFGVFMYDVRKIFLEEHASKLVSFGVRLYFFRDYPKFLKWLPQFKNLKRLSVYHAFSKKEVCDRSNYGVQTVFKHVNQGLIELDSSKCFNTCSENQNHEKIWKQMYEMFSEKMENVHGWSYKKLYHTFTILVDPERVTKKWAEQLDRMDPPIHQKLKPEVEKVFDFYYDLVVFSFYEALSEKIALLPCIEYVNLVGHTCCFESPRFQKLLVSGPPTLKKVLVTERFKRQQHEIKKFWFEKHISKVEDPCCKPYFHYWTIFKYFDQYCFDIEPIRKEYHIKNYQI